MVRRRTYLAALATGASAVAGCGEPEARDDEEPATPTATTRSGDPDVRLVDAHPGKLSFDDGAVVDLYVEVRNAGADGAVPLEVALGDETVLERSMQVDGDRHVEEVRLEDVADGYYEYAVTVGDDTATGTFRVGTPVEKPKVVTSHTVLGTEERSVSRAERLLVDVEVRADPYNGVAPPDREALLDVCRKLVLDALESTNWDVLRFDVWRETQNAGDESPHATITWGPDGNWSGVGSGADGDFSNHDFDVAGAPYLVTDGVDDVETDRWSFTVEFDVVNRGLERETLAGSVSTPETDEHRFAVDLEPGERRTVRYDGAVFGVPERTHYSIEADGDDRLYGQRSAEIRFS